MKIGAIIGSAGLVAFLLGVLGVVNVTFLGAIGMIAGVVVLASGSRPRKRLCSEPPR